LVAVLTPGIFLRPAWGLYDSIKGDKFKHIDFSHG
jgi:hypothetical protein